MNVHNPLAFLENYKAVKARLDPRLPVRVNLADVSKDRRPKTTVRPVNYGTTLARPPHRLARTIYLCPIGPSNSERQTLYPHPIGPVMRDILNVSTARFHPPHKPTFRSIMAEVCAKYGVTKNDILSSRRTAGVTIPRHELFYRLKRETLMSFPEMGRRVGGRDHTTALSAVRRYTKLLQEGKVTL